VRIRTFGGVRQPPLHLALCSACDAARVSEQVACQAADGEVIVDVDQVGVPFADFVAALRDQIRAAQADADPNLPIELGPMSVEFTLLTRWEGEGRAGVRFWVIEAGVSAKRASESTQKVTMELQPLQPSGRRARVRDEEPHEGT
jgi:Trypsin-co-occurring domain 2